MKATDKGLLSLGSVAALIVMVAAGSALTPKSPSHKVVAKVVDTYITGARFPHTVIVAHAPHAIDAHGVFREDYRENCRVGDVVDGTQAGITLKIDAYTCRRPSTFAESRNDRNGSQSDLSRIGPHWVGERAKSAQRRSTRSANS